MHSQSAQNRIVLERIAHFLSDLARTAEQLSIEAIWAAIFFAAFVNWLRGKILRPVTEADQFVLPIPT